MSWLSNLLSHQGPLGRSLNKQAAQSQPLVRAIARSKVDGAIRNAWGVLRLGATRTETANQVADFVLAQIGPEGQALGELLLRGYITDAFRTLSTVSPNAVSEYVLARLGLN